MGAHPPVLMVQILENEEKPILKRSYLEYITESYNKSFNDLKNDIFLYNDNGRHYHHCVLKICYYDNNNKLQEYKEANIRSKPLLIKESRFKVAKDKNPGKKNTIPIVLLNNGECMCEQLIMEKCQKTIEERYKGRESQYKKEIEEIKKKRDEAISKVLPIEEIKKQSARKDTMIQKLKEQVDFINKEKESNEEERKKILEELKNNEEERKKIMNELNNMKEEMKENPNNQKSLKEFDINKRLIENDIIKIARSKIDIYFEFHKFIESYKNDMKSFQDIIKELLKKEKYETKLSKDILKMLKDKPLYKENENKGSPIKHFNILVLGPSGVGKSTLINSMLLLDENINGAKTSVRTACTKGKPKEYSSEKIEGIRLFDTQGIEMGEYNITAVKKDATELINEKISSGDPDKYIHCIWYCVSETKFHKEEQDYLRVLMLSYHQNILPIIIVYGKAVDEQIKNQMLTEINKFIEKNKEHKLVVIPLLAKEMANIKPFGRKKLLEITLKKLEGALESSCYEGMRTEKLKQFQDEFDQNLLNAQEDEKKEMEKQKTKEFKGEDFHKKFITKLEKILNIKCKEDNLAGLLVYCNKINQKLYEEFEKKMNDFVIIYAENLFTQYHNEYQKLDRNNHSEIIKQFDLSFLNMAKETIRDNLKNEIKNQVLPKTLKVIEKNLIDGFKAIIDEIFGRIILQNDSITVELKTQVDKIVKSSYKAIYDKIDNCLKKNSSFYEDELSNKEKKEEKKNTTETKKDGNEDLFADFY